MKNFKQTLFAMVAIFMALAVGACTKDPGTNPGKTGETKMEVNLSEPTSYGVTLTVVTNNVKEFAYVQRDTEVAATAILQGGVKTTIADATVETTTTIELTGLESNTTYKYFFAFRLADNTIVDELKVVEFTTIGYGDSVLTVVDRMYDGFSIYVQIPDEVKARGNALRYSTSSMPMYNYAKSMGSMELDMLLYNAQQFTTTDKLVIYDEEHSTETDEEGNLIYDENGNLASATYADPKVPGEPGYFLIGEYAFMDDTEERIVIVDGEVITVNDDSYMENSVWWYPAGWQKGYYNPMYDWARWYNELGTEEYNTEKYWNGYYERLYVETLQPETIENGVAIKVTDITPIDACISMTPSDEILQYCILVCTESEYETQILPLLENNEEHMRWFTGSYFAMMSFGIQMAYEPTELWITDWFVDTKGMAGQTVRVCIAGIGDNAGTKQSYDTYTFTLPEVTLPKPDVVVKAVKSDDPYSFTFNIKNPNPDNAITEAYFACNYVREFDAILTEYSYTSLLKGMGNQFPQSVIDAINSADGFNFTMSSRDNATSRLAVLAYNWEGSGNNPDDPATTAIAEYTTPNANFPVRVNSELFQKLTGEWVAEAPMRSYVAVTDAEGNATGEYKYEDAGVYSSEVTIMNGLPYSETVPQEVYDIYAKAGISREETEELYEEFVELTEWYNTRTRGFNRLLCLGYNFAQEGYMLDITATPYDLFIADDYSTSQVSHMFYDFGPKWNLEIDADGSVWLPIDIEREYPLEAFNFGLDYTFYMLAVGERTYLGGDVVTENGTIEARFPVEVSADYNTITIKPIVYTDGAGTTEHYYPCVAQIQNGYATPLNPRVKGDVVLTRKSGATAAVKANAAPMVQGATQAVPALGKTPVPMQRDVFSMTSFENIQPRTRLIPEQKIEAGAEAYHKRAKAAVEAYYGVKF